MFAQGGGWNFRQEGGSDGSARAGLQDDLLHEPQEAGAQGQGHRDPHSQSGRGLGPLRARSQVGLEGMMVAQKNHATGYYNKVFFLHLAFYIN